MSIDKRMDKEDVVYTHTHTHTLEYYSAIKKNETMPFAATWMRLSLQQPRDYHIKRSKLEKDK